MTELLDLIPEVQEISAAQKISASVDLKRFFNIFSRFWDNKCSRKCNALLQTRFDLSCVSSVGLFHNRFGFLLLKIDLTLASKVVIKI